MDLEILAAQLRRHTDDLSLYGGLLINVLSAALPPELVRVRREGKWTARLAGRREPAVLSVAVTLGQRRFELDRAEFGAPPTTKICHQSGGVVMSTSVLPADAWCRELAGGLAQVAGTNQAALDALSRLIQ